MTIPFNEEVFPIEQNKNEITADNMLQQEEAPEAKENAPQADNQNEIFALAEEATANEDKQDLSTAQDAQDEMPAENDNGEKADKKKPTSTSEKRKKRIKRDRIMALTAICLTIIFGISAILLSFIRSNRETLQAVADANGKTPNVTQCLKLATANGVEQTNAARLDMQRIPPLTYEQAYSMDLTLPSGITAEDLSAVTQQGLVGLEADFVNAEATYGVNCVFLMSIAILESGWGVYNGGGNNMFGYMGYRFSSKAEGIMTVAKGLSNNYLSESGPYYMGAKDIPSVWAHYAASETWGPRIANFMVSLYNQMRANNLAKYAAK